MHLKASLCNKNQGIADYSPPIKTRLFLLTIKCLGNIFISFQLYWSLLYVAGGTDVFLGQEQGQLLNLKNTDING